MSLTETLLQTVQTLPEDKQQEVLDFADFLRSRTEGGSPPPQPKIPLPAEPRVSATVTVLDKIDDEIKQETPEQAEHGESEWEAFRNALNETRTNAGARLIYP